MLLPIPAASILSRIPSAVIVLPSTSAPMWAWASKIYTPEGSLSLTHAQIPAIVPEVKSSMLCLRSVSVKVLADLQVLGNPTTVQW